MTFAALRILIIILLALFKNVDNMKKICGNIIPIRVVSIPNNKDYFLKKRSTKTRFVEFSALF